MPWPATPTASTAREDNAGAIITPDTLARAEAAGLNAKAMLADNDPWTFFSCDRRPARHRPDAHQRQRFPGRADRTNNSAARTLHRHYLWS